MRKTKLWLASLLAVLLIIAVAPSLLAQDTTVRFTAMYRILLASPCPT